MLSNTNSINVLTFLSDHLFIICGLRFSACSWPKDILFLADTWLSCDWGAASLSLKETLFLGLPRVSKVGVPLGRLARLELEVRGFVGVVGAGGFGRVVVGGFGGTCWRIRQGSCWRIHQGRSR